MKAFPEHEGYNEDEEERLENIVMYGETSEHIYRILLTLNSLRARGKGPPKKKRTADGKCDIHGHYVC